MSNIRVASDLCKGSAGLVLEDIGRTQRSIQPPSGDIPRVVGVSEILAYLQLLLLNDFVIAWHVLGRWIDETLFIKLLLREADWSNFGVVENRLDFKILVILLVHVSWLHAGRQQILRRWALSRNIVP